MRFFTSALLAVSAAVVAIAQSTLTINTPTALFTCDPYLVTWSGGEAPYTVRAYPAGNLGTTPLGTLVSGTSATSLTWQVNLAAGTDVTLAVTDNRGTTIGSAPVIVQAGTSTSCVGGAASTAASTGSQGATSAQSSAVSTGATTLSSSASSASSASSTGAAAGAASSSSSRASEAMSSASSVVSSGSTRATGASGSAPSSTPSSTSGASTFAVSGALGLVGAVVAVFA